MAAKTMQVDQTADYRSALMAERVRVTRGNTRPLEILALPVGMAAEDQAPLMHDQFVTLRQHRMDLRKLKLIDALWSGSTGENSDCVLTAKNQSPLNGSKSCLGQPTACHARIVRTPTGMRRRATN